MYLNKKNPYAFIADEKGKKYKVGYIPSLNSVWVKAKRKNGKFYQVDANTSKIKRLLDKNNIYW